MRHVWCLWGYLGEVSKSIGMGQGRSCGMSVKIDIMTLLSRAFVYKVFMGFNSNHF